MSLGYIIIFDEPSRAESLKEYVYNNWEFSEALSVEDWKLKTRNICLFSLDGSSIEYVAIVEKGKRIASLKNKFTFKHILQFNAIKISDISDLISYKLQRHFIRSASGVGGQIPLGTWKELLNVFKEHYSDVYDKILKTIKLISLSNEKLRGKNYNVLSQEKDAFGLCLDIFGKDKSKILPYCHPDNDNAPFLTGLNNAKLDEDSVIMNDNKVFGDWELLKTVPIKAASMFYKNGEKLTVINANRNNIERTLGVDLVYYHHTYKSFILIQYKMLRIQESEQINGDRLIYWPNSDANYKKEYEVMKKWHKSFITNEVEKPNHYRLNEDAFYFKLCSPLDYDILSHSLMKGMYIPLSFWDILINSEELKGKNNAVGITHKRAKRWINNSQFIDLIGKGWIGTTNKNSDILNNVIKDLIDNQHSVTIGIVENESFNTKDYSDDSNRPR